MARALRSALYATEDVKRDESGEKKSQILRENLPRESRKKGNTFWGPKLGKFAMA